MGKVIGLIVIVSLFLLLFFPRWIPRLFRKLGRSAGDLGRVGREFATGEEEPHSPLARYEVLAGDVVAQKVHATSILTSVESARQRVEEIGGRLAAQSSRKEIPYRFFVLEDHEPKAFAVPGGQIFITRALLDLCGERDDAVACLLGHEVAHIDLRHALRNVATKAVARAGAKILLLGRGGIVAGLAGKMQGFLADGYQTEQELEADRTGVRIARAAGYDASALRDVLEQVRPRWSEIPYFEGHPPPDERIRKLASDDHRQIS